MTVIKILTAFVFVSMIGGISIAPAFARDDNGHDGYHRHGKYEHNRRVYQHRGGYYAEPVYAPPSVVYVPDPYQSPGISLVFPIQIR
jgi:hypothetical protein